MNSRIRLRHMFICEAFKSHPVCLFNGISTFLGYLRTVEEQMWYYLTHSWKDKGVHTFPKGICPKVNVIALLEFELVYYDSDVKRFNHETSSNTKD